MTDVRKAVREEIERMCNEELLGFKEFLATYPTPAAAARRAASLESQAMTDEERVQNSEASEQG